MNVPLVRSRWVKRLGLLGLTVVSALPLLDVLAHREPVRESGVKDFTSRTAASRPAPPPSENSVARHFVVEATGRDFRWRFRILEPSDYAAGMDSDALTHHLTVPEGAVIDWKLTSDDYIYTFSIPSLGINEVAAPDVLRQWRSGPLAGGSYDLLVDPICGFRFFHEDLMGRVTVKAEPAEPPFTDDSFKRES